MLCKKKRKGSINISTNIGIHNRSTQPNTINICKSNRCKVIITEFIIKDKYTIITFHFRGNKNSYSCMLTLSQIQQEVASYHKIITEHSMHVNKYINERCGYHLFIFAFSSTSLLFPQYHNLHQPLDHHDLNIIRVITRSTLLVCMKM